MQLARHPAALSIPDDPHCYHHDELRALTAREMAIYPVLALLVYLNNDLHGIKRMPHATNEFAVVSARR